MDDKPADLGLQCEMDVLVNATRVAMLMAGNVQLDKLEQTFERALDVGALFFPSEWIRGNRNASVHLRLVRAWKKFIGEIQNVESERAQAQERNEPAGG